MSDWFTRDRWILTTALFLLTFFIQFTSLNALVVTRTGRGATIDLLEATKEKQGCCGSNRSSLKMAAFLPEAGETYKLTGTYYSLNDNLTASLMLNNKGPAPMLATPTLYSMAGTRLALPPITVPAASYIEVDMHQLLAGQAQEFREGSLKISYQGGDYQLGAQIKLIDPQQKLVWAEQLVYTSKFTSSRLENVWWLPSEDAKTRLVVSNTSGSTVTATISVDGTVPRQRTPYQLSLAPWETRVLDILRDLVGNENGKLNTKGGISIEHSGNPGAVLARMYIAKPNKGYSATANFIDPENTVSSRWHGNGFRFRNVDGANLTSSIAVRNVGTQPSRVKGKIIYTKTNGGIGVIDLLEKQIAAGATKVFDLDTLIDHADVPVSVQAGGIEIEYDTAKGTIVTAVQSASSSGEHVFQVPMSDPQKLPSSAGGFPWKADGDYRTLVYIKNETGATRKYTANLVYAGGGYNLGIREVRPGETVAIDFKTIRDEQIPDAVGNVIPLNLEKGQIGWSARGGQNNVMSARSEQISVSEGVASTYSCYNCCSDIYVSGWIEPASGIIGVGDYLGYAGKEIYANCYFQEYSPNLVWDVSWLSLNSSIATIDSFAGEAEGISPGGTWVAGSWTADQWTGVNGYCQYDPVPVEESEPIEVVNIQKIQYRVNSVWTDIPSGGIGPICNGTSVSFRAVPSSGTFPSGQPTWGGDASGTGAEVSVTFSTAGDRTVSATSGNNVSAAVKVGPANANITVTWAAQAVTTNTSSGSSTTSANSFVPEYIACLSLAANEWQMRVKKVDGGSSAVIRTGGYRNTATHPPTTQTEGIDANTEMNDYYPNGSVQGWHTPAASTAHENYHDQEYSCATNHFWTPTEPLIEALRASYASYSTEAAAISQMRTMTNGANTKMTAFSNATIDYVFNLPDNANSRPYAAGQVSLNTMITTVSNLATTNGWVGVPGIAHTSPNTANPCHATFPAYP